LRHLRKSLLPSSGPHSEGEILFTGMFFSSVLTRKKDHQALRDMQKGIHRRTIRQAASEVLLSSLQWLVAALSPENQCGTEVPELWNELHYLQGACWAFDSLFIGVLQRPARNQDAGIWKFSLHGQEVDL
jgi:hypothetical protein